MRGKGESKYLYYHLDYYKDGVYQFESVVEDLEDVFDRLKGWETEFDTEEISAEIRVRGIGLTVSAFEMIKHNETEI